MFPPFEERLLDEVCPYPDLVAQMRLCGIEVIQGAPAGLLITRKKPQWNYISLPIDATEALWRGAIEYLVIRGSEELQK